jgi:hypothetical protein
MITRVAAVLPLDTVEIGVVIGGLVLIGLVLWYFFGFPHRVAASADADGGQGRRVLVEKEVRDSPQNR